MKYYFFTCKIIEINWTLNNILVIYKAIFVINLYYTVFEFGNHITLSLLFAYVVNLHVIL